MLPTQTKRHRRHRRVRARVKGTSDMPRFCVFRSNKYTYAQLIDDSNGVTLASISREDFKIGAGAKKSDSKGKVGEAHNIGKLIAQKALDKKIGKVVFDRGGYKYHGRVKALAEGAREGGLKF